MKNSIWLHKKEQNPGAGWRTWRWAGRQLQRSADQPQGAAVGQGGQQRQQWGTAASWAETEGLGRHLRAPSAAQPAAGHGSDWTTAAPGSEQQESHVTIFEEKRGKRGRESLARQQQKDFFFQCREITQSTNPSPVMGHLLLVPISATFQTYTFLLCTLHTFLRGKLDGVQSRQEIFRCVRNNYVLS